MGTCLIVCAKQNSDKGQREQAYISTEESARIEEEVRGEPTKPNQDAFWKHEQPLIQCKTQGITKVYLRQGTPTSIKSRFFRQRNTQQIDASICDSEETVHEMSIQLQRRVTRKKSRKNHKKHHFRDEEWDEGGFDRKVKLGIIFQSLQKDPNDANRSDYITVKTKKVLILPCEIINDSIPTAQVSSQSEENSQNNLTVGKNILTINYKDGSTYTGEMKEGKRNGKGVMRWKDGSIYDGEWKENCLNGHGKLVYADKDHYIGQFNINKAEGIGEFYSVTQGVTYEGEWKEGLPDGKGTEIFRNGQKYSGQWQSGKKNGFGQLIFEDGVSFYRGNFLKNELHGHGEYFWSGRSRYRGQWRHNQKSGYGILWWQNGQRFEGQFLHDKMHGHGIFFQTNGSNFDGNWECGRRDGVFIETTSSGQVRRSVWYFNKLLNYVDADTVQEHKENFFPSNLSCKV